jgi:hypothetical protein
MGLDLDGDGRPLRAAHDRDDVGGLGDRFAAHLRHDVPRLQPYRLCGAALHDLVDRGGARVLPVGEQHQEAEDDGRQIVGGRTCDQHQEAHPARPVRIDVRIVVVELLVRVHPRDLHEPAQRDWSDLVDRVAALEGHQRVTEADGEALDAHPAKPSGDHVSCLVQDDEKGET